VKKGDRVGIMMTNVPEWAAVRIAILRLGAWLVPFNTRYRTYELKMLLEKGEIHTLVFMDSALGIDFVGLISAVCPEIINREAGDGNVRISDLPYLRNLVCLGNRDYPGMHNFNTFIESGKEVSDSQLFQITESVTPDAVSTLLFTAGTTGKPKGVLTKHSQFLRVFSKAAERFDLIFLRRENREV
jgi:fatty-acyl-CoA synthase